MSKITIDFDGTLSKKTVQDFAKDVVSQGHDVWILTSRNHEKYEQDKTWNDDLYKVAKEVGIPLNRIHFCSWFSTDTEKWQVLKGTDAILHLDDDWMELNSINKKTNTVGISVFGNSTWRVKAEKLIKKDNSYE